MKKILLLSFFMGMLFSCKENTYPSSQIDLTVKQELSSVLSAQVSLNSVFHLYEQLLKPLVNSAKYDFTCPNVRKVFLSDDESVIDSLILNFDSSTCTDSKIKGRVRLKNLGNNRYKIDCDELKLLNFNITGGVSVDDSKEGSCVLNSDKLLFLDAKNINVLLAFNNEYSFLSVKKTIRSYSISGDLSFYQGLSSTYNIEMQNDNLILSDCSYIYSGKSIVSIADNKLVGVDYVDDTCSGEVLLSIEENIESLKF